MFYTTTLLVLTALAPLPDDQYEENDTCAQAFELQVPVGASGETISFTVSGPASAGGADQDWFRFDVPAGHRCLVTSLGQFPGSPGFDMTLRRDSATAGPCGDVLGSTFVASGVALEGVNTGAGPETYYVQFDPTPPSFQSEVLTMTVRVVPTSGCGGLAPDAFEPNESAAGAIDLPLGLYRFLNVSDASPVDHFRVQVPIGDAVRVGFGPRGTFGGVATLEVRNAAGSLLSSPFLGHFGIESYANLGPADHVIVKVERAGSVAPCEEYDLLVEVESSPCAGPLEDVFDAAPGNNGRFLATPLTRGFYPGLRLVLSDRDWYRIEVPGGFGARLTVETQAGDEIATKIYAEGDPELFDANFTGTNPAVYSWGAEAGSAPQVFDLEITRPSVAGDINCANYSIQLEMFQELSVAHYCDGDSFMGVGPASLRVFGSDDLARRALWVSARDVIGLEGAVVVFGAFAGTPPMAAMGAPCGMAPYVRLGVDGTRANRRVDVAIDTDELAPFAGSTFVLQAWANHAVTELFSDAVTFTIP